MNRKGLYILMALTVSSLLLAASPSNLVTSGSISSAAALPTNGFVQYTTPTSSPPPTSILTPTPTPTTSPTPTPQPTPTASPTSTPTQTPTPSPTPTSTPNPTATPIPTPTPTQTPPPTYTRPANKAAIIYGYPWSSAEATYAANNFDLLVVDFQGQETSYPIGAQMANIKALNSAIRIFGYKNFMGMQTTYEDWSTVNSHETWFVHDASGNRIKNTAWGWYLMDVGNAGYRQHWVDYVNNKMSSYPAYSGVFADDVWDTLYTGSFDRTPPASVVSRWHTDSLGMINYIKANLGGRLLMVNTEAGWAWGHINYDYLNAADGMLIEGYYHAPWEDSNSYSKVADSVITCLATGSANGKIMLAESGSTTNDERTLKFSYSAFMLGTQGSTAYWGWNTGSIYYDVQSSYQSIMETNLGSATGAYYRSQNVYMRDFTGGKVLCNPTATSYTVNLGANYKLLDGTTRSSLTLGAYSGEILTLP